jgi:hypothetical protein
MSSKATRKTTRPLSAKPSVNRSARDYAVEQENFDLQHARVKKAPAGKSDLRPQAPVKVEFAPAPVALVSKSPASAPASTSDKKARLASRVEQPTESMEVKIVNVSFTLIRPDARRVSLCGEFNGWSPEAGPMTRDDDGNWEAIVALRPGRYEYKFLVDGEWLPDPVVQETVPNNYGSRNSVIKVGA